MKTLYVTDSSCNIVVDKDTDFVGHLPQEDRYDIRSVYYMEEPMHVVYQCGERREEIDAKKGDILLVFYNNRSNKYILDTIKTKQWVKNIKNRHELEQKEKEEWAKKNAECDLNCCTCDNICEAPCCDPIMPKLEPVKKESVADAIKKTVKKVVKKVKKS